MRYIQNTTTTSPKEILRLFYKMEQDLLVALENVVSDVKLEEENMLSEVYCEDILEKGIKYDEMVAHGNELVLKKLLQEIRQARELLIETNKLRAYHDYHKSDLLHGNPKISNLGRDQKAERLFNTIILIFVGAILCFIAISGIILYGMT